MMEWFNRSGDEELDDEIRFHLEMEAKKNREQGMSRKDADVAARRSFGGIDRVKEELRDLRPLRFLFDLRRDLWYAARSLRRAPAYSITTILTIGIAVGVSAGILTFVAAIALRPLPYEDIDRSVTLWERNLGSSEEMLRISPANYLDWKTRSGSFEQLGLLSPSGLDYRTEDRTISLNAGRVSEGWFPALGISPLAGRIFDSTDFGESPEWRVMISHRFWKQHLGADPKIVGKIIELDQKPARVLAVLPDDLNYPNEYDVYAPLRIYPGEASSRTGHWMWAAARLKEGISRDDAQRDLDRVAMTIAREHPETNEMLRVSVISLEELITGKARRLLTLLSIASLALLVAACSNVGALALARGAARRRQLAIRAAIGAGPARLLRQLAAEPAILIAMAATIGLALATGIIVSIASTAPADISLLRDVRPGFVTAFILAALALVAFFLSGILPSYRLIRGNLAHDLESSRRDNGINRTEAGIQGVLVVVQVALAILLLIGAALLVRSLDRLTRNQLGFDPSNRVALQLFLYDLHPDPAERNQFVAETLRSLESIPGVLDVEATTALPFDPAIDARDEFEIVGRPRHAGESLSANTTAVTPGFFEMMEMPLVEGRPFNDYDRPAVERVTIVGQAAAERFWPGRSPIGERVMIGIMTPPREWRVIGVVGDVRHASYDEELRADFYMPLAQTGVGGMTWVAHVSSDSAGRLEQIQNRIFEISPGQSIASAATMEELVAETLRTRRFALILMSGFGLAALLVSTIGLYGLIRYICARRTTEVGIRMAIGATPRRIERLFIGRGLGLAISGITIGMLFAIPVERLLEPYLYETSIRDHGTLLVVIGIMMLTTLIASWVPARKVARLDPSSVLRID